MENVWKAGTTMSDVEELGKLDALHQAGTDRDTEFAAEQAKLLDEILASADLGSPVTPEVRSIDETSDAELSHDEGRAALAAPPGQPQGQAVSVSEAAYGVPAFVGPMLTATTTPGEDVVAVALDAARQAETGSDIESGAETANQREETPAGAEPASPGMPAVVSIDETGDGELSHDEGRVALAFPPAQPQQQAVTLWPLAYSAPVAAPAPVADTTTSGEDVAAVALDAARQAETGSETEAGGEEAKQPDEAAAGAELDSLGTAAVVSIDETSDGELSHDEGRAALASPPVQPLGQAVTAWPGAYGVPAFAGPLFTGFTTLAKDEAVEPEAAQQAETEGRTEPAGEPEAAHQAGTEGDTEPAGEEAKLEETPAGEELDSPGTAEDRAVEETSDTGTPPDQEPAKPAPAAEQPAEEAVPVWPGAYSAWTSAAAPFTDTTTTGEDVEDVEAGEIEAAHQARTEGDTEPAGEEAKLEETPAGEEAKLEETPAVVELDSPATAEDRTVEETSDAGSPPDQEQAEAAPAAEQPTEEWVPAWPGAYSAPTAAAPFTDTTTGEDVEAVEAGEPEATLQAGTEGDTEPAGEEAKLEETPAGEEAKQLEETPAGEEAKLEEPPAVVELDSPGTAEVRPVEETSDTGTTPDQEPAEPAPAAERPGEEAATVEEAASSAPASAVAAFSDTTTTLGETRKSRRRSPALVAILAAVFLVAALGAGFVAVKQTTATRQWRQRDRNEVALNRGLSAREGVLSNDLASTHATITFLNSQTSKLNGQVKSLQTQLSAVAAANRKALNHNGLLTQLTNQAGTVSNELAMCVGDVSSLRTEIDSDLSKPSYKDARLQPNMHIANQVCATARQDGQQLQSALRGA
jgi:hypothetical protein